jgi:hypothetical protein
VPEQPPTFTAVVDASATKGNVLKPLAALLLQLARQRQRQVDPGTIGEAKTCSAREVTNGPGFQ